MQGVRNLGGFGGGGLPSRSYIPPEFSPIYKIEIETSSETYDVTLNVIEGTYTDGITETIGNFEIKLDNSTQQYESLFSLYDTLNIYLDYGTTATTLRFVGKIERLSKQDNMLVIAGRSPAARVVGKNITYSATDKARSEILTEIIEQNFSGIITTNNIQSDTGTASVSYEDRPFWDIVTEICASASFDAYIDVDFDFHYFESGSILNETDMIIHDANLISTGDFSPDLQTVYNSIRVYGSEIQGLPVFATASDEDSIALYDTKDLKITDTNIKTVEQARVRAEYELARNKDPVIIGQVESLMLPTLQPGQQLLISDPLNSINPGNYTIQSYTHLFSNDDPEKTIVTIQKNRTDIPTILKKRIRFETGIQPAVNPNNLDNSHIINFNVESGTNNLTEIVIIDNNTGYLRTTSSVPTNPGTWTSDFISIPQETTEYEIRVIGDNLDGIIPRVSTNGGSGFTNISLDTVYTVSNPFDIQIQLVIPYDTTTIKAIGIYYS